MADMTGETRYAVFLEPGRRFWEVAHRRLIEFEHELGMRDIWETLSEGVIQEHENL